MIRPHPSSWRGEKGEFRFPLGWVPVLVLSTNGDWWAGLRWGIWADAHASSRERHRLAATTGASPQDAASGADCVAAPSRDLREQAWVRAFLVNGGSRHGGSSGRAAQTPSTVRMTHVNTHWCCRSNTVTKQQEASHTDHWHCIVIEIWVSISLSLSLLIFPLFLLHQLNTSFSADSSSSTYSYSVTFPLSSALHSRVFYTHPPPPLQSSQTLVPSSASLLFTLSSATPFCAAHSFPCCAAPSSRRPTCVALPSRPLLGHLPHTHGLYAYLWST